MKNNLKYERLGKYKSQGELLNLQELGKQEAWSTQKTSKAWSWTKTKVKNN
jgi:hypothetical protein